MGATLTATRMVPEPWSPLAEVRGPCSFRELPWWTTMTGLRPRAA